MKFKVGSNVKIINLNNSKNLIVVKSKKENITDKNIDRVIVKSNIKNLKEKVHNVDLGNFDYLLFHSYPSPYPIDIEKPLFEFVFEEDLTNTI